MEIIHHIIGRTIQTYDPGETEMTDQGPKQLKEYEIVLPAQITLNGEPAKIADLLRGDSVRIGSGREDGFHTVEAVRHPEAVLAAKAATDLSHPRVLQLVDDSTTTPVSHLEEKREDLPPPPPLPRGAKPIKDKPVEDKK